ncbi:MAG: peptidyl-prolyl cis-trans isomerase [Armatimonadetes bacterium]|nr:peptidyl-prolyl cis-trans isomerase [Armatimonadota bacterium]
MKLFSLCALILLAFGINSVLAADASAEIPQYPAAKLANQDLRGGASVFEYNLPANAKPTEVWAFYKTKMGLGMGWVYTVNCDTPWGLVRVCKPKLANRTLGIAVAKSRLFIFNAPTEFGAESLNDWLNDVMLQIMPPVAIVDGQPISSRDYYRRLERIPLSVEGNISGLSVLRDLISECLQVKLAKRESVVPTAEQIEEAWQATIKIPEIARQFTEGSLTQDEMREMIRIQQTQYNLATKGVVVTDKEVEEYYNQHKAEEFTAPEQAVVAAIFAKNKDIADKAAQMLREGKDFGEVALELSDDKVSAKVGGRLRRPITRGSQEVPKEVQDIVLGTPVGQWTDPIEAGGGEYVIFKVLDKKEAVVRPIEDVRMHIRQKLMLEKGKSANDLGRLMQQAWRDATIKVNLRRYQTAIFNLIRGSE